MPDLSVTVSRRCSLGKPERTIERTTKNAERKSNRAIRKCGSSMILPGKLSPSGPRSRLSRRNPRIDPTIYLPGGPPMKIHEYQVSHQKSLHHSSARDVENEREIWPKIRGSIGDHPMATVTGTTTSNHRNSGIRVVVTQFPS